MTADEFASVLENDPSAFADLDDQSNIVVSESALTSVTPINGEYPISPADIPANGKTSFGNIEGIDPSQETPQTTWDNVFYWTNPVL